ncbi:hypothetical protein NPIL_446611 [Nephila pilipes]|uniref:Uncharacterized protein n=1 Tax=Nephila pilipes TaxID=299642 RepID=A0A8X6P5P2_NEPPI|nr:hypothetical protein NPIL_446611 [Nephila pilipes]
MLMQTHMKTNDKVPPYRETKLLLRKFYKLMPMNTYSTRRLRIRRFGMQIQDYHGPLTEVKVRYRHLIKWIDTLQSIDHPYDSEIHQNNYEQLGNAFYNVLVLQQTSNSKTEVNKHVLQEMCIFMTIRIDITAMETSYHFC